MSEEEADECRDEQGWSEEEEGEEEDGITPKALFSELGKNRLTRLGRR